MSDRTKSLFSMVHPTKKKKKKGNEVKIEFRESLQLTALPVWPPFFLDFAHETVHSVFVYPCLQGIIGGQLRRK